MLVGVALLWLSAADPLSTAEAALARGEYAAALQKLESARERPARWHLLASKAHEGLLDPAKAVAQAEAALKLEPGNLTHHLQLAQVFLSFNTPAGALEVLTEAEALFPEAFLLRLAKGLALKELQRYAEAGKELAWCLAQRPDSALAFDALATTYLHEHRYADLRELASAFRKRNPGEYRGPYFVAAAREGELLDAAETLVLTDESLARNERFAAAHALKGKVLLRLDRPAEALLPLRRAVELRPDLAQAHLHLANALRKLGDEEGAAQSFATVRRLKEKEREPAPSLRYHRGGTSR